MLTPGPGIGSEVDIAESERIYRLVPYCCSCTLHFAEIIAKAFAIDPIHNANVGIAKTI